MFGPDRQDFSELAYHIVQLRDYWKRRNPLRPKHEGLGALRNMIEIALGVGDADEVARAVMEELDLLKPADAYHPIHPDGIEVLFISALLQEKTDQLSVPAATKYWASVFQPSPRIETLVH